MNVCDLCIYNPPSSCDGKPCTMCPATTNMEFEQESSRDAISRQAADEIKELMTDINGDTVYAVRMSDLRQLPSVNPQEPKWIPVSERLPKDEVKVLIYTTDNKINKAYRRHKEWTENQREWLVFETLGYGYIYEEDEVLAWMPLPEPYKPQEGEDKHSDNRWCNTCEFKHLESECFGCAEYDEFDNLINLRNYKKGEE